MNRNCGDRSRMFHTYFNYGKRRFQVNNTQHKFHSPLSSCCRQWRGVSGLRLLERWSPQTRLKRTAEVALMVSHHWCTRFLLDHRHQLSLLTKLHADVLIRILLPQFFITVCVTHEGENHILNDALKNKINGHNQGVVANQRMSDLEPFVEPPVNIF